MDFQFKDKFGKDISPDDVIYNGRDYYRIYWNDLQKWIEAISCTKGYIHDINQAMLNQFERIGTYKGNEHLFDCD